MGKLRLRRVKRLTQGHTAGSRIVRIQYAILPIISFSYLIALPLFTLIPSTEALYLSRHTEIASKSHSNLMKKKYLEETHYIEGAKARKGEVTCPRSQSQQVVEARWESKWARALHHHLPRVWGSYLISLGLVSSPKQKQNQSTYFTWLLGGLVESLQVKVLSPR